MCGEKKCNHDAADLCSCGPVQEGEVVKMFQHLIANMTAETWELGYKDLNCPDDRRLCLVGVCSKCGGRLCVNIVWSNKLVGSNFVADIYWRLRRLYHSDWQRVSDQEFWDRFIRLFHEQDQPFVSDQRTWLEEQCKEEKV